MPLKIIAAPAFGLCAAFAALKILHIFQLEGYRVGGSFRWARRDGYRVLSVYAAVGVFCVMLLLLAESVAGENDWRYLGFAAAAPVCAAPGFRFLREPVKVKLKYTPRLVRLFVCTAILSVAAAFGLAMWRLYLAGAVAALGFVTVIAASFIMSPVEALSRYRYIFRARRKLSRMNGLIKIGITGSYGKTGVKDILAALLSAKFRVCASPGSYNTSMGLCRVINDMLKADDEVLICEMGARRRGDIRALTRLVRPDASIITAVGKQHLETFKTLENIAQTKYEIVEGTKHSGFTVFNGASEPVLHLFDICPVRKILACTQGGSAVFDAVETSANGSEFRLIIKGQMINCTTRLLGAHNITNITLAAAAAYELGVSLAGIAAQINKLKPSPHRLELLRGANGMNIIDDSYNANPDGVRAALAVLKMFGENRIVVTPGLVELGEIGDDENLLYGREIAGVANSAILLGRNASKIRQGMLQQNFRSESIHLAESLSEAQAIIGRIAKAGDTILFANDLPDNL